MQNVISTWRIAGEKNAKLIYRQSECLVRKSLGSADISLSNSN